MFRRARPANALSGACCCETNNLLPLLRIHWKWAAVRSDLIAIGRLLYYNYVVGYMIPLCIY